MTTTLLIPVFLRRLTSVWTAGTRGETWNGPRPPGVINSGMSSFENPTSPILVPSKSNTAEGDHSAGVFPCASTMLDDRYGKFASGISVFRRYCSPLSKLWFPSPSAEKPIRFMMSIVGVSPKNDEIGGVAPTESPAATVIEPLGASERYRSNQVSRNADPPIGKVGFAAPPPESVSDASVSGTSWPW